MSDAGTPTTALAQPASERVTIDGLQLHYLDWGNPAGPPLVCVHGYTSSADAFNAFARHFRDRFHIIALDVRGHGESQWSRSLVTWRCEADHSAPGRPALYAQNDLVDVDLIRSGARHGSRRLHAAGPPLGARMVLMEDAHASGHGPVELGFRRTSVGSHGA